MFFGRPLAHFLAPFRSLLAPFGSLLAPSGSLLAPFGSLWLPFGSLLAPFGFALPFLHHFFVIFHTLRTFSDTPRQGSSSGTFVYTPKEEAQVVHFPYPPPRKLKWYIFLPPTDYHIPEETKGGISSAVWGEG